MKWMNFRIFLVLILVNFSLNITYSQGEANNWYFGSNAGISFNTSPPTVLNDGALSTNEGCSSISNANGELLFYTDGRTIWNTNHQIMNNADYFGGTGLNGDPSSTSSGLIVPHPTDEDLYFVFTVDEPHHENAFAFPNQGPANPDGSPRTTYIDTNQSIPQADDGFNNGFNYSVVDMSLNGGLGDVVPAQKNIELLTYDPNNSEDVKFKCSEKITAVRGENCNSIWVITHFKDTFYAFFIDDNGLNETPVTSQVGPFVSTDDYRRAAIGYLKASPNGDKLITANQTLDYDPVNDVDQGTGNVYLFDFDSNTGLVSNALELVNDVNAYSVEFSPEGTKAYASVTQSDVPTILQWDLEATDVPNSIFTFSGVSGAASGAIQLAPNGKIYRSMVGENFLSVINNPELPGNQANYSESLANGAISLGTQTNFGLPPFIQSLFADRIDIVGTDTQQLNLCDGEGFTLSYQDITNADYTWSVDGEVINGETDSTLNISQPPNVDLPYQETYTLDVDLNDGTCGRVGIANVTYFPLPETSFAQLTNCVEDIETNTAEFDLTEANDQIISDQANESDFEFTYYESISDAQNNINAIENPENFNNTETPQTLGVVVENIDSGCSSITELTLDIQDFNTEEFNLIRCDVNENGIQDFDLTSIQTQEDLIAEAFYLTENAALNGNNPITTPENFTNDNPFQQDVFFTIENGTPCKDLGILSLEVISLPDIENDETVFYCVEDFPNPITLTSGVSGNQLNSFEYTWIPSGETTSEIAINEPGIYEVGITSIETGCTNFKTIEVVSSGLADFNLNIDEFNRENNTVEVLVSDNSLGDYEYALDNPDGPYQDSNIFENVLPGIYDMFIRDKNGCGIRQKTFGVLGVMPFFTPNNDGINDVWGFKGTFNNKQALAFVYIFDRYGKLLKSFRGLDKFWDGFYNNKAMPSQDYWYKIVLEDGRKLNGHFTLKR
ncbi:T9SS type B sorting domain-containing protein [Mesohalobacter halotolerans]|uniref:T9SS type B sorting domain-containing protein n=1 Tax=Mesohalobacter halotolerans TaxID=1883405 RepID=A0A4U5TQZ6_9FLAO|nr:T9SS type B sorting domain-containing protein [Mesohalobacter halotolerans]TKS55794.1 T9SS type B sorting domain-containing protein [Mesohalobacter halotolerans]